MQEHLLPSLLCHLPLAGIVPGISDVMDQCRHADVSPDVMAVLRFRHSQEGVRRLGE